MENDILNKCITQGNNLVQVCTGLHQRLVKVEEQNKKLIELNTALLKRVVDLEKDPKDEVKNVADVVGALIVRVSNLENKPKDAVKYENGADPYVVGDLIGRVTDLEQAVSAMPEQIDAITAVVNDTKALVEAGAVKTKSSKRTPRTYETYQKIVKAQEGGMSMKLIAKEMDIPYTTVVSYFKMSQDEIDALPRETQEPADAEVSQSV